MEKEEIVHNDIRLLQQRVGRIATMEFREKYPDGYKVHIIKVNDDGSFEGQLIEVVSCI
jgi:hypothetical protein